MATRKSCQAAQELVTKLQKRYPKATFRIIDNSKTMQIGRKAAEMKGFEIIKDGSIMVMAQVTQFEVLEVRECQCGTEILTIAIGEWGLDECTDCHEKREARQAKESQERRLREEQRIAEAEWRNRWEEE